MNLPVRLLITTIHFILLLFHPARPALYRHIASRDIQQEMENITNVCIFIFIKLSGGAAMEVACLPFLKSSLPSSRISQAGSPHYIAALLMLLHFRICPEDTCWREMITFDITLKTIRRANNLLIRSIFTSLVL